MFTYGDSYLLVSKHPDECYELFKKQVNGKKGLLITREPAHKVKDKLKTLSVTTIWLTNIVTDLHHVRPQDIEQLSYDIEKYMQKYNKSVVLLAGVEYLMSFTSFKEVLHLIQTIRDVAALYDVLLLISIGEKTFDETQLGILSQELKKAGGSDDEAH